MSPFVLDDEIDLCQTFSGSICLSVCHSPTGHILKPIFTRLHQTVELIKSKKPIDFEVKRTRWAECQRLCEISKKIINFHPNDLKFEENLHIKSVNSTTNCISPNVGRYFGLVTGPPPAMEAMQAAAMEAAAMEAAAAATERF